MIRSEMITCGWEYKENLKGEIGYPDGRKKTYELSADGAGSVILAFAPNLDDPEGVYTYSVSNGTYTLQSNAYFYVSNVPRLYYLSENQILFHNFLPHESVQLVMFSKDRKVDGGMNFVVGNTGELVVTVPDEPNSIYIGVVDDFIYEPIDSVGTTHLLGQAEGATWLGGYPEVYYEKLLVYEKTAKSYRECSSKTSSIFESMYFNTVGYPQYAKVAPTTLKLYNEPRYSAPIVEIFKAEQPLELAGGPYCFDNAVWWAVTYPGFSSYTTTNIGGYVTRINGYVVEIDKQNNHNLEKQSCGDLPTRLSRSDVVLVSYANGNMKNLRKQPGFSQEVLDKIPEGTYIEVWDRWCIDNTYWWYVSTQDNQQGWMTESQNGVYFLEPAPK